MSEHAVAFLSKRKLHVRKNGATYMLESEFERTVRERTASIQRRHAWKTQGRGANFMGGVWAAQANAQNEVPVVLTGLTSAGSGSLLYTMETDAVSGLFLQDASGAETRLFHTADFCIRHASLNFAMAMVAITAFHKDSMTSNIAVLPFHGNDLSEITEGDSFDQMPQWVPGSKRVVFQSAGVGRDVGGRFAGLGPCTIQEFDLESGALHELAAESGHDLLQPRKFADGTLYYIRKPYESGIPQVSLLGSLKDTVLFPFRLGRAIMQYFNFFSMMYTGKPLVTRNGAVQRRIDPRQLFIYGNLATAQMTHSPDQEMQDLVPSSWELVRYTPGGQAEVVARNVLAYDLASDNSILYSDGAAITRITPEGRSEKVLRAELIERVLAL